MSFVDRVEQQRAEQNRAIALAEELRGHVESLMPPRFDKHSATFYGHAYERAVTIAGQRIAASEAEVERLTRRCAYLEARLLQRSDPASRGMSANQDADSFPPRLVGSDKNAHSHHEKGQR